MILFYQFLLIIVIIIAAVGIDLFITSSPNSTPPPPPVNTNTALEVEYNYTYFYELGGDYTNLAGTLYPTQNLVGSSGSLNGGDVEILPSGGFVIQYGVDYNTNPWMAYNGQVVPQEQYSSGQFVYDPSNYWQFVLTINGVGTMTYAVLSTNADPNDLELTVTNESEASTNDSYVLISFTPPPSSTNAVIIERSTNLLTWLSISTNLVQPGNVNSYTDTTIFLPSFTTYYNTNTGEGGGGYAPPGETNSSTNGVITIPAGAYYRLEYPSNQTEYLTN